MQWSHVVVVWSPVQVAECAAVTACCEFAVASATTFCAASAASCAAVGIAGEAASLGASLEVALSAVAASPPPA